MSGSSRNSDRRSDNAYPTQKTRRPGKEKETSLFDRVSRALNPRTYLEAPAQRQVERARDESSIGWNRRARERDAAIEEASGGRPRSGGGGGRSKR